MTADEMLALAKPIEGWMYDAELVWLFDHSQQFSRIVEIGVWAGRSTMALCCGAVPSASVIHAIDHFQGSPGEDTHHSRVKTKEGSELLEREARNNLGQWLRIGLLQLHRSHSAAATALIAESTPVIDMLFLDGGHDFESVDLDLDCWYPLLERGGLICGHDRHWPGVHKAITKNFGTRIDHGPGSIWYVTR